MGPAESNDSLSPRLQLMSPVEKLPIQPQTPLKYGVTLHWIPHYSQAKVIYA